MNLKDMKIWATQHYAMDNVQLMAAGVKDRYLSKVKPHLRSIIDKASEIIAATELSNRKMDIIESDVRNLRVWGLAPIPPPEEPKDVMPEPEPEQKSVEKIASETKPEKSGWYSKK